MIDTSDREWLGSAAQPRRNFLAVVAGIGGLLAAIPRSAAAAPGEKAGPRNLDVRRLQSEVTVRLAILDGLSRYCRALDRGDRALQDTIWHKDATAQYLDDPVAPYAVPIDSTEKFIATMAQCHHRIANVYIEVSGDRAVSEAYADAVLREHPGADGTVVESTFRGRFFDRWTLRDGRWAIQHRRFVGEMFGQHRYSSTDWPPFAKRPAKHDKTDESYQYFT